VGNQRGSDVFPGIQLSYADKGAAMSTSVTLKTIQSYKDKIDKEDKIKIARNAAMRNEVTELAMDWEHFRKIDHSFSDVIISGILFLYGINQIA